jgi:hypothetical protein
MDAAQIVKAIKQRRDLFRDRLTFLFGLERD